MSTLIGTTVRRNGVPGSAHSLRHWYDSKGVKLRVVQGLMRHASIAITQIYTGVFERDRIAATVLLDPYRCAA